jgi:hypothetical protein
MAHSTNLRSELLQYIVVQKNKRSIEFSSVPYLLFSSGLLSKSTSGFSVSCASSIPRCFLSMYETSTTILARLLDLRAPFDISTIKGKLIGSNTVFNEIGKPLWSSNAYANSTRISDSNQQL